MDYRDGVSDLLGDLPVLVALAEVGSVTGAADELGMPQPSASRALARLGRRVGVPLTTRQGRTVELTEAGRQLARAGSEALESISEALAAVRRAELPGEAHITIAYQAALGEGFLPRALTRYRTRNPRVRFRLLHGLKMQCLEQVASGEADIALVADVSPSPGTRTVDLYREPLYLVASRQHRLAQLGRAVGPDEIPVDELMMMGYGFGLYDSILRILGPGRITDLPSFEVDDYRVLRGLVAAGAGVTILPSTAATSDEQTMEVPIAHPAAMRTITAVMVGTDARCLDVIEGLRATAAFRWRAAPAWPVG